MSTRLFSILFIIGVCPAWGQVRKQIIVERQKQVKRVSFSMKTNDGRCSISPCQNDEIVTVYTSHEVGQFNHVMYNKVEGDSSLVLNLQPNNEDHFRHTVSSQVLGADFSDEALWKVYLTESLPYTLDLHFGLGDADIDLSNTTIKKLKINTGSANITVFYRPNMPNRAVLDTFFVSVGMGTLRVKRMSLARPKVAIAEVCFGKMYLDMSTPYPMPQHIIGSVGAGTLIVQLPPSSVPVKVSIQDSFLCQVNLCSQLCSSSDGEFMNAAYRSNPANNALTFNLDVSVGKIIFLANNR